MGEVKQLEQSTLLELVFMPISGESSAPSVLPSFSGLIYHPANVYLHLSVSSSIFTITHLHAPQLFAQPA